jgi:hypothetical protein
MIPRWLVDKRMQICAQCERATECKGKFEALNEAPNCPLKKLATRDDEVAARAWPDAAEVVSGCCDSAQNYLPRKRWV